MIFTENKEYQTRSPEWRKLRDLYEADSAILKSEKYLYPHELELSEDPRSKKLRAIREQRSAYTNYIKPFIKRFISLIFRNPIGYELAKELIFYGADEQEFNDVDGYGNSLESFIKNQVAVNYFLYGKTGIYVDSFPSNAQTLLQQRELNLRPFMECWNPLEIIDWKYSSVDSTYNGLDFAVRRYKHILPRSTAKDQEKITDIYRHVYLDPISGNYTIEIYQPNDKDANLIDFVVPEPAIDFIPLSIISTDSWLKEGADKSIHLYNLESTMDNVLLYQAHQRLFAIGNFTDVAGKFAASEGNLVVLRGEGSITSIEPVDTNSIERRIAQIKSTMFQLVFHNTRQVAADSKAVESVETLRESKEEFRNIAKSMAQDLEQVVNQSLWHYAKFKGHEIEPEKFISIDSSIEDDDIEEFAIWMNTFGDRIRQYPEWQKAVDKKAAQLMNLTEADLIIEEIDQGAQQNDPIMSLLNGIRQDKETDNQES